MGRILAVLCLAAFVVLYEGNDGPQVQTKQGVLRGKYWKSRDGRTFNGFSGIPYAKPPVDSLRFEDPVPAGPWKGTLDATEPHAVCPQISIYVENNPIIGDEDCLYLNVFTPKLPTSDGKLLPVMLYIHGGSFAMGSGRHDWFGPEILLNKDIVLVTINYRLGALGFLSTADDIVPGNSGLKDQSLALKWVKNNVVYFGGDPERITVFGNSAGALSTHLHMFSPLSRDLISGAIVQSASALTFFAVGTSENAIANANKLGTFLNCSTASSQVLVSCLKKVDAYEILRQEPKFASWDNDSVIPFKPMIENNSKRAFLTEHPIETLKSSKAANIPLMTGIVAQETAYKTADFVSKPVLLRTLDKLFNMIVPPSFGIASDEKNVSQMIRKFYFGDRTIDDTTRNELTEMYTDGWFTFGNDLTVRLHTQHSMKSVYQYFFNYRASTSYSTLFGNDPNYDYGVCHTDELLHLFRLNMTFPNYVPTDSDLKMSEIMSTLWTNFAMHGNPTPEVNSVVFDKWVPVQTEHLEYYNIQNYSHVSMSKNLYQERVKFWRGLPVAIPGSNKQ